MAKFEFRRLLDTSDDSLCAELRRVANVLAGKPISKKNFDEIANVSSSTISKRFGGWKAALERTGLGSQYGGPEVSRKVKEQPGKDMTKDQLVSELRRVAHLLGRESFSVQEFNENASCSVTTLRSRFGSWKKALAAVGFAELDHGKRYSEEECFENLLTVWTHYGRPPKYQEMRLPPSTVGPKAYIVRWGTWNKALYAFHQTVSDGSESESDKSPEKSAEPLSPELTQKKRVQDSDRRDIKLGLRYKVLKRDSFKCVLCGRNPATTPGLELHVDHITPFSKGGKTVESNLQATCAECNIGKGNRE